jgi:hypothetical protein
VADILIKNGWIFNGRADNILTKADLLVHGNKIQTIGLGIKLRFGTTIINAEGRIISPGFVDLNNQLGAINSSLKLDDLTLIRQGITTAIVGGLGQSIFKYYFSKTKSPTTLSTEKSNANIEETLFQDYSKYLLNVNLGSFLGWETAKKWGINTAKQLTFLLDQTKKYLAGISLEFNKNKSVETLEIINDLIPVLSKRGKNLMLFFSNGVPTNDLIIELGELSLKNQITIAINSPLLGCWSQGDSLLEIVEEQNKKGAKLIFKLWPYTYIPWNILEVEEILQETLPIVKNLDKIIKNSFLYGSKLPDFLQGKTMGEINKNWGIETVKTLEKISHLMPTGDFQVLIPYILSNGWWESSCSYVGLDSVLSSENYSYPNIISGVNHFLESRVGIFAADKWSLSLAKITSQPALFAGLSDRGFLQKDYLADIVILNPDKLKGPGDYQNPVVNGEGIETVIINGQVIWNKGRVWKKGAGRLLI